MRRNHRAITGTIAIVGRKESIVSTQDIELRKPSLGKVEKIYSKYSGA